MTLPTDLLGGLRALAAAASKRNWITIAAQTAILYIKFHFSCTIRHSVKVGIQRESSIISIHLCLPISSFVSLSSCQTENRETEQVTLEPACTAAMCLEFLIHLHGQIVVGIPHGPLSCHVSLSTLCTSSGYNEQLNRRPDSTYRYREPQSDLRQARSCRPCTCGPKSHPSSKDRV